MVRRLAGVVLAVTLMMGVFAAFSPLHAGMMDGMQHEMAMGEEDGAASMACLLHCLSQADHDVADELVVPLVLVLAVAIVIAALLPMAPPVQSFAYARAGPISWSSRRDVRSIYKRE